MKYIITYCLLLTAFVSNAQDFDSYQEAYVTLSPANELGKICNDFNIPLSMREKFIALGDNGKADMFSTEWKSYFNRTYHFSISSDEEIQYLEAIRLSSKVELVEVLDLPQISCVTNDPSEAAWNSSRHILTKVPEAHCITQGSRDITIAVIDNGFQANTQELVSEVIYVEAGAYNGQSHGTGSAVTAAGATNNGFGIRSAGYNTI
ncbi:MAG: hypothetical protein AB8F78_16515 [Saprospiraceae bacterium]